MFIRLVSKFLTPDLRSNRITNTKCIVVNPPTELIAFSAKAQVKVINWKISDAEVEIDSFSTFCVVMASHRQLIGMLKCYIS